MLVLTGMSLFAQDCDCLHEFEFVKNYMEENHPGLNSGTRNTSAYRIGVIRIEKEIIKVKPGRDCNLYLNEYLLLAKDHHTGIGFSIPEIKRFDTKSKEAFDSFYKSSAFRSTLKRKVDTAKLLSILPASADKIAGLYQDGSGSLRAFIKEKGKIWNYKGVVIRSTSPIYPVGTARYEIMERPSGAIWAKITLPDHQHLYTTVTVNEKGIPLIALQRIRETS